MSEKEGTLRMMASGRWAVCRAGREPVETTSGERFRIEFLGEMRWDPGGRPATTWADLWRVSLWMR